MTTPRKPARRSPATVGKPPARPVKAAAPRQIPQLKIALDALDEMKALETRVLDVRGVSDVADYMVVASGTSDRHVRAIAGRVVQTAKAAGIRPFGTEGEETAEWVLVDLPDVMVHVMLPRARELYQLEQLWEPSPARLEHAVPRKPARGKPARGKPAAPKPAGSRAPRRPAARGGAAATRKPAGKTVRRRPKPAPGG